MTAAFSGLEPFELLEGQERRHLRALHREDAADAIARAHRDFPMWAVAIVGRPIRSNSGTRAWWLFTVETRRLR